MANGSTAVRSRALAYVTLGGVVLFVATTAALHWLQPGLNPLTEAVSYYVHGVGGWLLTIGLLSLGLGSLALTIALCGEIGGRGSRAGLWCLAVWSVGAILGGAFAADPAGNWDKPPSMSGSIHGGAAMIAFITFPIAAMLLSRALRANMRWTAFSGVLLLIAKVSAVSLVVFMCSLAPVFVRPGPPILLGVTERIALAVYAIWLGVAAVGVFRVAARRDTQHDPTLHRSPSAVDSSADAERPPTSRSEGAKP
jgi:hypothetical protein